jgi:hypothetical protein
MPDDRETWRRVARGLDEEAQRLGAERFPLLRLEDQLDVCHRFANAELHGGVWGTLNVARAWSVVVRHLLQSFYSHPWAWNEIGFGGPAYPRGYARMGVGLNEAWEGEEAIDPDPVPDVKRKGWE